MRLTMETGSLGAYSHKERLAKIKAAGFDGVDFSFFYLKGENAELIGDNYRELAEDIRKYMDEIGLPATQAHAPFRLAEGSPFSLECPEYRDIVHSIEAAAILGAPAIVVHRVKTAPERVLEYNREYFLSLLPYAERAGIKIAIENLFVPIEGGGYYGFLDDPRMHIDYVRSLGSPYFSGCLDFGHLALCGHAPEDVIRAHDPEVYCFSHIHDNDFQTDMHRIPYAGRMNWDAICAAMREMGYRGDFSLELIGQFKAYAGDEALIDAGLKYAHDVGRALIKKVKEG